MANKNIKVSPIVLNYYKNEELLKTVPHKRFLDLAIVYKIQTGVEPNPQSKTRILSIIDNNILNTVPLDVLFSIEVNPEEFEITSLYKILTEEFGFPFIKPDPNNPKQYMYVISNKERVDGAVAITSTEILDKACKKIKEDFPESDVKNLFVIPSSRHEIIVLPQLPCLEEEIEFIHTSTQAETVADKDFLSNHVYTYDSETKKLEIFEKSYDNDREHLPEHTHDEDEEHER